MADLVISTLEELKSFRDEVNAGNTFAGKTVELAANIDLMSEEWTPIGNNTNKFQGTFDGKGYTVSNLVITGNNSNAGFFGFTASGAIKNLTIDNASVSGYLNVGVVAGTPYTSTYSNIKLTGVIKVDGYAYVGGMFGKNLYADASDLVIDASDDSYVKANSENYRTYVGGVIGFMGEGNITVSNVTSNIRVEGSTCDVGGIVGIAHYNNKFENVTCTADEIKVNNDDAEVGGIAGVWHNQDGTTVEMINCNISESTVVKTVVDGVETDVTETNGSYGAAYTESKLAEGGSLLIAEAVKTEDGNTKIEFTVVGGSSENVESRLNDFVCKVVDGATLSGGISYDEETNTYSYTTSETIVAVADGKYYTDYSAAPAGAEILFVVKQNAIYVNGAWGGQSDIDASLGTDSGVVWNQNAFASLNDAVPVAAEGAEIILSGDTPILADAIDVNVNVTLSGNAVIQRNNKNFLIGYGTGDAKLTIAEGSVLDFTNNGTETDGQGIIVSDGRTENGVTDRYHGELFIDNAYVKASYFINRNITTISGDGVAVSNTANFSSSNGFYIGSRPESETGDTNVATVTINNKAFVDASGTNEVLVGYEGAGMLVVNDAKFVADRQNVDVASGSSIQLVNAEFSARSIENAGTVNVSGNSKLAITELTGSAVNIQDGATLTDSNVGGYVWIMGTATLAGDNAFTGVNLYGGSDAVLNIGADAALAVTNDICMRDGSTMNVYGTISASALSIGGSTLTVDGGSLEAYVEDYHADQTAQVNIVNGGSVTLTNAYRGLNVSIDTASTLTLTGTVYGDFTFDVTHTGEGDVFAKIVDVVNDNVSIDFSVAVANNGNLVVFGNDLYYSNLDLSVYIVDSEFDSDVVGYGIYKFSNITDAVKAAEANGGATINLTDEAYSGSTMGPANAGLFQTNGTYTFTGGNYIDFVYVDTPRPTTDNAGTVDVNIVFDNAKVTAGKFRLDNGASLTIKDSFVDAQIANGASVGWTTFYGDSTIRVENSVIGWYNTAQTVESSAITAGDRETNYYNVAPYGTAIGDMCYLGSGVMETVGSTVFTYVSEASDRTALGVYDRGLMSFTDSAVYAYTLRVGMSSSNKTVGRDDEVATMIFDNSTLRNSLGEAGERIFVGDGGDTAGSLIIRNNSVVDKSGAAMTVANNGTVSVADSELNVKSLSNAGTVNVSGTSTLDVVLTGNGKFNILGGTEDAPTSLSGKITSEDKETDLTLKEGTILLGADTDISLSGYTESVYSEFIVGGTDNTTTDVTDVTMSDGAKVSAQRVWIGGEYDKEKDTAAHTLNVTGSGTLLNGHSQIGVNIRRDGVLNVSDGGEAKASDLVVRGTITVDNAKLTANGGNVYGEGNNIPAVITVENKGVFTASGTQVFQIGHASAADRTGVLNVKNGSIVTVNNLKLEQSGSINMDYTSTLAFDTFVSSGTITVDTAGFSSGVYKIFDDLTGSYTETEYRSLLGDANWNDSYKVIDNDLYLTNLEGAELYVDSAWASMSPNEEVTFVDGTKAYYKLNAFDTVANALALPSGETAYENAVKLNITGAVKSNISVIGSNITEVNSAAKTADENAVIVEDALTVNLVQIDNTEAGWEVYYPLAAGSAASVYGGITTNFVSGLFTFETTRDPNIIGGAYGASDAKIYGSTTVNIGTDGGSDSDVGIYVDALVGSGGGTINGNSSVNIYSGTIERTGSIIGGSSWGGVVKGDSSVNIYGGNLIDSSDGKSKRGIMGGSYNGVTEGNASVNIYGGTVNGRIYAGGSQAGTTVKGNASVNISDGVVNGSIYGTGGVVEGSISISVTGGTIKGNIYAGGLNVGVAGTKTVNISDYSNPDKDNKNHFYGGSSVTQSGTADALLEIVDGDVIMNVADTEAYADIFGGASVTKSNYVFVEAGSSDVTVKNLLINGYDSGKTIWTGRVYGAGQISNSGNSSVDNYDVYYQASSNVHVTNIGGITVNKDDGSVTHNPGARVYGGGYLYWSRKSEMTVGSTNVVVDEDLQKDSDVKTELAHVIGGSLISGTIDGVNASTIITGNTDVTVNAGVISAWLVGGNNSNWFGRSVIGVADENGSYEYNGEKYSAGSTKVTLNDGGSETLSIIGGSLTDYASYYEAGRLREAVVFGKTEIIMNGGTAYEAVGGGYALYQNQNADTSGKLTGVENPLSNVEGETNVTVNGGTIKSNVIGGGYAYSNQAASLSSIANVTGNTFVAIGGTAAVEGNVYGGGYADGGEADVTGNTSVNVTGGTVAGNIYGGGYHANVNGNATVTITGGTVSGDIYGSGEGEATVNGSRTLNLGSADAAAYAATLNNVYDFNVAQVVNADVTVTGDFSVEEITIAGATLTLNSGFLAATTAVAIEIGAYNVTAAALNVGVSGVNQPSITISAAEELTAGRYLVASGFDSLSGFTVDGINDYTLRLQGEDVYLTKDLAPDDYDANGRPDILMQHDIGKLQVSLVQEDQSVILKDVADLGDGWTILGSGQSGNGENYADIYLTNGETVGIWQLDETTGVTAWQEIQSFDSATHVLGLGDFNGDGITDLLLQNDNGAVGAYLTDGENVGWNYFQSLGSEWSIAGIGDFNHDGIDDVVLQNEKGGYAGIWQLDRNGQVSWSDLDVLNNGQIAGTGDFNGDGFDDVLLKWGNSYGAWTVSGGNLSGWMDLGTLWDSAALEQIGDFNGDGIDDLRVRITNGDLGAFCVLGEGNLQWNYHFSVGSEWQTNLVSI